MEHNLFEEPVRILVGLGYPAEIASVKEAFVLLDDWPPSKRNAAHAAALNACRAALAGQIDAETARGAFVAFARRNDLLAPETDALIAARSGANVRALPVRGGPLASRMPA